MGRKPVFVPIALTGVARLFAGLCLLQVLLMQPPPTALNVQCEPHADEIRPKSKTIRYYLTLICCAFYILIGVFIFGLVTTQSFMRDVTSVSSNSHGLQRHISICEQ